MNKFESPGVGSRMRISSGVVVLLMVQVVGFFFLITMASTNLLAVDAKRAPFIKELIALKEHLAMVVQADTGLRVHRTMREPRVLSNTLAGVVRDELSLMIEDLRDPLAKTTRGKVPASMHEASLDTLAREFEVAELSGYWTQENMQNVLMALSLLSPAEQMDFSLRLHQAVADGVLILEAPIPPLMSASAQ